MELDYYGVNAGKNLIVFEFVSEGPNGKVPKLIRFSPTEYKNIHNLAFGNVHAETGQIDDLAVSNNGDSERILATIVAVIYIYTERYPDVWVHVKGSTKSRTRLYRMGISKYWGAANNDFHILGQINNEWEPFVIGTDYEVFAMKRKLRNFEL